MNAQHLKNSILQEAIEGRLVPQDPNDEPASVLLERIRKEKARLVKEGKLKKKDLEVKPISEDEIPFKIPESWEWVRISEYTNKVTDFVASGSFASLRENVKYYNSKEYAILVRTKDFQTNFKSELVYTDKHGYDFLENSNLFGGELILPNIGASIGKVFIVPKLNYRMTLAPNTVMIRFVEDYQRDWVYILFLSMFGKNLLYNISSSTAQGKFNKTDFKELVIPIPPLAEQKRIVAKIEELLPKVEEYGKAQETLNKLNVELPERLKKSILQEAIEGRLVPQDPNDEPASVLLDKIRAEKKRLVKEGKLNKKDLEETPINEDEIPFDIPDSWEWVRLNAIALDSADGPFGSNLKSEHYTTRKEVRIIQLSNIGELGWKNTNTKYTTYEHLENISRSEAFPGDVIIAKMMPAGRAIICPSDDTKYVLSSDAVRFDFDKRLNRKYLYYAINSPIFINQVYSEVQGITRVRTSLSKLRLYSLPLPPLAEQKRIVEKIEQLFGEIDKLKGVI